MGKSTAFNAFAGRMTPNLGDWLDQSPDWNNVIDALPKGELRDFFISVRDGGIKVALKPQNVDRLPKSAFKAQSKGFYERSMSATCLMR